jgi:hypothetical protein
MRRQRGIRPVLLALVVWGGCSEPADDLPREAVSGTVTLDRQPLEKGMIQFVPAAGRGETQAGAPIERGSYSIPKREGPVPGRYTVVITAPEGGAAAPGGAPGKEVAVPKERIPAKYNTKSTLTFEVKKGEENRGEFPLTTK